MRAPSAMTVPLLLVLAGLVAGCGGSAEPQTSAAEKSSASSASAEPAVETPDAPGLKKLIEQVKASAGAATSARMVGTGLEAGKSMTFDLRGNRDGSNAEMTVTQDGQGTAVLRNVDGTTYVRGDAAYWSSAGAGAQASVIGDRWISMPASAEDGIPTLDSVFKEISALEVGLGDQLNIKVETVTLDGQPAYRLSERVATDNMVLWVSADGKANLLKFSDSSSSDPMEVTFSEWNAVPAFTAPPAEDILSL